MSCDLLSVTLSSEMPAHDHAAPGDLVPIDSSQREDLARLYLASYPPHIGALDIDDARGEMDETFAGEFGKLRTDASWFARLAGKPAGAILVVERSIWDDHLDGPFIIDVFVHPEARGAGLGRALLSAAMRACQRSGASQMSLRVGEGTSASAYALYETVGFTPIREH